MPALIIGAVLAGLVLYNLHKADYETRRIRGLPLAAALLSCAAVVAWSLT